MFTKAHALRHPQAYFRREMAYYYLYMLDQPVSTYVRSFVCVSVCLCVCVSVFNAYKYICVYINMCVFYSNQFYPILSHSIPFYSIQFCA
jgi:hypothetical protein